MRNIFRTLLLIVAMLAIVAMNVSAQAPHKGVTRAQDIVPPVNVYYTQNAEIDAHTGVPRAMWNVNAGPYSGTAVEIARQYLSENSAMLQMRGDLSDIGAEKLQHNLGVSHVSLQQAINGVPVFRGDIVVSINSQNYVTFVSNNYKTNLSVTTTPGITAQAAIQSAKNNFRFTGKYIAEPTSALMIYAESATPKLTYRVEIINEQPLGDWEIFVDANNGSIVASKDVAVYEKPVAQSNAKKVNGSGNVYFPDPLTSSNHLYGAAGYVDGGGANTPQLLAEQHLVTLKDITFTAGVYKLQGPNVQLVDFEAPNGTFTNPANPDSFRFIRSQNGFEEVMCYYWIDSSQRWIQSLGFDSIQHTSIGIDPDGLSGADNSHYLPGSNQIAYGHGGVDDDQDIDVIWHEYGHAIQNGTRPGWGGGEEGGMGEGFGDYWAGSISRAMNNTFSRDFVFTWDAGWNGTGGDAGLWPGRPLNDARNYPNGGTSGMEVHDAGQLWASVLMQIWDDVGKNVLDKLVLKSHYYMGTTGTMPQNAQAIIQADRDLFGGAHVQQIVAHFGARNYVNPADFIPQIQHTPFTDTENLNGPYHIVAKVIAGTSPINASTIKIHWGRTNSFTDSVLMTPTGNTNEYAGNIPGNGSAADYRYYISAKDSGGNLATYPTTAPTQYISFHAGFDVVPPVIGHTPLRNQGRARWPAKVSASVTDNLEVDSVWVDFYRDNVAHSGSFALAHTTGSQYSGNFNIDTNQVHVGDSIFYKVVAKDNSTNGNITTAPASGFYKFYIIATKGSVLVINDDPSAARSTVMTEKGLNVYSDKVIAGISANLFASTLTEAGYIVDATTIADVDPSAMGTYDIVVLSSGINADPVLNVALRAALVDRVQDGGRVWVEGGEIGYDFRAQSSELDANFRQNVLHDSAWASDNSSGDVTFVDVNHPLFNSPNVINAPITFTTRSTYADKDAMGLLTSDPKAMRIGSWSAQSANSSIIVWNVTPNPSAAKVIFTSFAIGSITDSTVAKALIENGAEFLMTPEAPATGAVSGTVTLQGAPNNSGASVRLKGPGHDVTVVTGNTGYYHFGELYPGVYKVYAWKASYYPTIDSLLVQVSNDSVTGKNFTFTPVVLGVVHGTVTLSDTNNYSGVLVEVVGQGISTTTNGAGEYTLNNITPGAVRIRASKNHYTTMAKDTVIGNGGNLAINFTLSGTGNFVGLEEGFDGDVFPPDGWSTVITTGDSGWRPISTFTHSGNTAAYCRYQPTGSVGSKWLITKQVTLNGAGNSLSFWARRYFGTIYPPDTLYVRLSFASQDPGDFTTQVYKCYTGDTNSGDPNIYSLQYKKFTVDLGSLSGDAYIAFVHEDNNGDNIYLDDIRVDPTVGVKEQLTKGIPTTFSLSQNYPNPFNPSTMISFGLPKQARVTIRIFNVIGQEVATLLNEVVDAGYREVQWNAGNVSTGVYFYRMDAQPTNGGTSFIQMKKMLLLK